MGGLVWLWQVVGNAAQRVGDAYLQARYLANRRRSTQQVRLRRIVRLCCGARLSGVAYGPLSPDKPTRSVAASTN